MTEQTYTVRAILAPGFNRRWCAGIPWGSSSKTVKVVDKPKPLDLKTVEKLDDLPEVIEMTPEQLADLKSDRLLAVSIASGVEADADEANAVKAELAKLHKQLAAERKANQAEIEQLKVEKFASEKRLEEQGAKIVALENQIASLSARSGEKPRGR